MADKPVLRYHRAQWDLLLQYGSPAFFYKHTFGSPIETDSDWDSSPRSVVEAPIAEESSSAAAAAPSLTPEALSSTSVISPQESSLSRDDIVELIRDYRRQVQQRRSSSLESNIGRATLSPAAPSSILATPVQASPSTSLSIEERLEQATLNAKVNREITLDQSESPRGRKIQSNKKVSRRKRDTTPTPSKPQADPDLSPEVQTLLEYQRDLYGGSSSSSKDTSTPRRASGGILGHVSRMINAKAISALLTDNVDENTTDWVLFTIHGNLLGYSDNTSIQQGRTVAAVSGGAWRIHNQAILKNDSDMHANADKFCKTLEVIPYDQKEAGLRAMIVLVDDMVVAVHDVKERLLIGAMLSVETVKQDSAITSTTSANASSEEGKAEDQEGAENDTSNSSEEGKGKGKGIAGNDTSENSKKGKPDDDDDDTNEDEEEEEEGKPTTKKQILVWRAEGMAEVLLGDLTNFKMPEGYF